MYVCSNITTNRKNYGKAEEGTEKVPSTKYSSFLHLKARTILLYSRQIPMPNDFCFGIVFQQSLNQFLQRFFLLFISFSTFVEFLVIHKPF